MDLKSKFSAGKHGFGRYKACGNTKRTAVQYEKCDNNGGIQESLLFNS